MKITVDDHPTWGYVGSKCCHVTLMEEIRSTWARILSWLLSTPWIHSEALKQLVPKFESLLRRVDDYRIGFRFTQDQGRDEVVMKRPLIPS